MTYFLLVENILLPPNHMVATIANILEIVRSYPVLVKFFLCNSCVTKENKRSEKTTDNLANSKFFCFFWKYEGILICVLNVTGWPWSTINFSRSMKWLNLFKMILWKTQTFLSTFKFKKTFFWLKPWIVFLISFVFETLQWHTSLA